MWIGFGRGGAWAGLAALLALGGPAYGQAGQAGAGRCGATAGPRVLVEIEGLRSDRGVVVVELYRDDSDTFLRGRGRVQRVRQKARLPTTTACIPAPEAGMFGLAMYHDENEDGTFNRNALGLPREGFGFSNNAPLRLGPPSFSAVRFEVAEGETALRVRMRYLGAD